MIDLRAEHQVQIEPHFPGSADHEDCDAACAGCDWVSRGHETEAEARAAHAAHVETFPRPYLYSVGPPSTELEAMTFYLVAKSQGWDVSRPQNNGFDRFLVLVHSEGDD